MMAIREENKYYSKDMSLQVKSPPPDGATGEGATLICIYLEVYADVNLVVVLFSELYCLGRLE